MGEIMYILFYGNTGQSDIVYHAFKVRFKRLIELWRPLMKKHMDRVNKANESFPPQDT